MNIYTNQENIVKTLIVLSCMCVCVYGAMIGLIMKNAGEYTGIAQSISKTTSDLAELEFEYITLKQSVTLERAEELGFSKVSEPQFVALSGNSTVSLNR